MAQAAWRRVVLYSSIQAATLPGQMTHRVDAGRQYGPAVAAEQVGQDPQEGSYRPVN
jgi:hypothetical protein